MIIGFETHDIPLYSAVKLNLFTKNMRCSLPVIVLFAMVVIGTNLIAFIESHASENLSDKIQKQIQMKVEAAEFSRKFVCRKEMICGTLVIPFFYRPRNYKPAWISDDTTLPQMESLLNIINKADREGLNPSDYHLANIKSLLTCVLQDKTEKKPLDLEKLADLDILATDAFLLYGSHLLAGRVNPETIHTDWIVPIRTENLGNILQKALDSNQIEEALRGLMPPHPGYKGLRQALMFYRNIAKNGGWPLVPTGSTMQKGERHKHVAILRKRLMISGDLRSTEMRDIDLFDDALEQAVRNFQNRHGLRIDGVVGPVTLESLNLPTEELERRIELNMERWRWIPHNLGKRHILVNTANFELFVAENGQKVMTMRVVVGVPYRRTPVFSAKITHLVLNPYWYIPHSIAIEDILPKILKDPNYLAKQNIMIFKGMGDQASEIDPETIDWSKLNAHNFVYRLRQNPGPLNALGRVKFMFPNKFDVYLHDTPAQELFKKTKRDFSSGCIRIEKPIDLAAYLLQDDPEWTREKLLAAIDQGVSKVIPLPKPIDVHLLYWTAWVDDRGTIHFRNDIYNRDEPLDMALKEKPPVP